MRNKMMRMRMRMMRITWKRRMKTMDDKHNDDDEGNDNNDTTINRKLAHRTRMWGGMRTRGEDKGRGQGTRTMRDNNDEEEDEED